MTTTSRYITALRNEDGALDSLANPRASESDRTLSLIAATTRLNDAGITKGLDVDSDSPFSAEVRIGVITPSGFTMCKTYDMDCEAERFAGLSGDGLAVKVGEWLTGIAAGAHEAAKRLAAGV